MANFVYELGQDEFIRAAQSNVTVSGGKVTLEESGNSWPTVLHIAYIFDGNVISRTIMEGDDGWYFTEDGVVVKKLA